MPAEWKGKSRGGKTGYSIFIFLVRHLGLGTAYALLAFVALYFMFAAPKATRQIYLYARKILKYSPLKSALLIYKNYFAFGTSLIDRFAISAGLENRFTYILENQEQVVAMLESHRGAIILGAHYGNWAAGEPFFRKYGTSLNLVMYDNEHEDIKQVLEENGGADKKFKIIPVNKDALAHIFMITEALDKGELVCFQGDRYLNEENLLTGTIMGKEVNLPRGPFLLASKMKVPVFSYFATRERHRTYRFRFTEIEPGTNRKETEKNIVNAYCSLLERQLKEHPEQWYNYYDFWGFGKHSGKN